MDAFGHVNNVEYLRYLEAARTDFLFAHANAMLAAGPDGTLSDGVVVARQEIDYLAPLVWGREPLEIRTWVERIGGASFTLAYDILAPATAGSDPHVVARARTVMVPYSRATASPRRLSDDERALLANYLESPDL